MVRETRHLWVGNLPDNIREDRIREHFKRYGRVQSVKLLPPRHQSSSTSGAGGAAATVVAEEGASLCAAVAFMDIKSASKAHTAEHKLDERCLTTEYYEPPTAPAAIVHIHERDDGLIRGAGAGVPGPEVGGAGGTAPLYPPPRSPRFPHGPPAEESFDRSSHFYRGVAGAGGAEAEPTYLRRPPGYLASEGLRGRARDRLYRNGPYPPHIETGGRGAAGGSHHRGGSGGGAWNYDGGGGTGRYPVNPAEPPTFPEESTPPVAAARQPQPPAAPLSPASSPALPSAPNPSPAHLNAVSARKSKRTKHKRVSRGGSGSDSEHSSGRGSRSSSRSSCSSSSGSSSSSSRSSRSRSPGSSRSCSPSGRPRRYLSSNSSHHNNLHSNPSTHADDRRPLAICVRNLPTRSSDTSLKDGLFHEYKKHGKVTWVKVVGQGGDRYAVVCFKKPDDVEKALEVSQDKLFFGCKIDVHPYEGFDVEDNDIRSYEAELDEFHPKATRTLFIGNLEKDITASELRKHFEQYGEIIITDIYQARVQISQGIEPLSPTVKRVGEIDIKKQGSVSSYAFCQYADIGSVVKAMRNMDGEHLGNNRIKLGFGKSMPTNCVWVDGVAESVSENYLNMQFHQFGAIVQIVVDRERGHALVFFEQISCAQNAVKEMRGAALRGRKLQIDFASRECQEAFYNHLESQGQTGGERPWERREANIELRETPVKRFEAPATTPVPQRFPRYEGTPARAARGAALHRGGANTPTSTRPAPAGYPGAARTNRQARYPEYYDEPAERRFSQGSAGHDDSYEQELRDYGYSQRERRDFDGSPGFLRHGADDASPASVPSSELEEGAGPGRRRSRQRSTASDQESPPLSRHPSPNRGDKRYTSTSYTRLIPHSRSPGTPVLTSPLREVTPANSTSSYYDDKDSGVSTTGASTVLDQPISKCKDTLLNTNIITANTNISSSGSSNNSNVSVSNINKCDLREPVLVNTRSGGVVVNDTENNIIISNRIKGVSENNERTSRQHRHSGASDASGLNNKEGAVNTTSSTSSSSSFRRHVLTSVSSSCRERSQERAVTSESDKNNSAVLSRLESGGDSASLLPPPNTPGVESSGAEIKHLQKERVHIQQLLEQLGESHSSGDEGNSAANAAVAKRLKLNSSDVNKLNAQGIDNIDNRNNDCHSLSLTSSSSNTTATFRKIEPRRLSDLKGRRISTDGYSKNNKDDVDKYHNRDYSTHFIPKRRKTESSSENEERLGFLHRLREESDHHGEKVLCHRDSSDSSRPGTPLCDERPENLPTEPRRQRDKSTDGPISLPLPRFAHQILSPRPSPGGSTGKIIYTIKSPPACVHRHRDSTSSRGSGPEERRPSDVVGSGGSSGEAGSPSLGPQSPQPLRPESSSESEMSPRASPTLPTLEERIRMLDEKYEKWSGSRALSTVSSEALQAEKFKMRTKVLDLNELRSQPSEIVKSVLAKRSVFDEDTKRLENYNEKYEPKDFASAAWTSRILTKSTTTTSTVNTVTSSLKNFKTEVKEGSNAWSGSSTLTKQAPPLLSNIPLPCVSPNAPLPSPKSILVSPSPLCAGTPTVTTLPKPTPTTPKPVIITPKSGVENSPRSTSPRPNVTSAAKGLQYPFPSHPPACGVSSPSTPAVSLVTASQMLTSPGIRNSLTSCQPPLSSPVQSASPAVVSCANNNIITASDLTASASDWTSRLDSSPVLSSGSSSSSNNNNNIPRSSPNSSYLPTPPPSVCSSPSVCSVSSQAASGSKCSPPATPEAPMSTTPSPAPPVTNVITATLPSATPASSLPGNHKESTTPSSSPPSSTTCATTSHSSHHSSETTVSNVSQIPNKTAIIKKENNSVVSSSILKESTVKSSSTVKKEIINSICTTSNSTSTTSSSSVSTISSTSSSTLVTPTIVNTITATAAATTTTTKFDSSKDKADIINNSVNRHLIRKDSQSNTNVSTSSSSSVTTEKTSSSSSSNTPKKDNVSSSRSETHKPHKSSHSESSSRESKKESSSTKSETVERKENVENVEKRKERRDSGKDNGKRESVSRTTSSCSSPASVGSKRRVSSQDSAESTSSLPSDPRHRNPTSKDVSTEPESKRQKLSPSSSSESKEKSRSQKAPDRRDSKDGSRRVESKRSDEKKSSDRKHSSSEKERKPEEKSSSKLPDEKQSHERKHESKSNSDGDKKKSKEHSSESSKSSHDRESKDSSERHRSKDRDKQRKRNKSERDKESPKDREISKPKEEKPPSSSSMSSSSSLPTIHKIKEEMDEEELYKQAKRESKERKKNREDQHSQHSDLSDEKNKSSKREKKSERRKEEEAKAAHAHAADRRIKERAKKLESGGSDSDLSEDGRMKKHSIFDIVDDEPAYISMYDKVKARSTKNMQKQEEEKQKEKLKEKFNQLKQSRAKREEKKRSTSWDEDSDSDMDKERSKPSKRSNKLVITSSSEDESCNKSEKSGRSRYEGSKHALRLSDISHDNTDKSDSDLDSPTSKHAMHKMRKELRKSKQHKSDKSGSDDEGSARTKFLHARRSFKPKITSDTSDYEEAIHHQPKHKPLSTFDIYSDSETEDMKKHIPTSTPHLSTPASTKPKSKESSRETFESSDDGVNVSINKFDKKNFESTKYKNEFSENETPNTQINERNHSNCIDKNSQRKAHKKNKKRLSSKKNSISVDKLPELNVSVEGELEVRLERLEDTRLKIEGLEHKKHTSKRERKKSGHKTEEDKNKDQIKTEDSKDLHHESRANKIRKKKSRKDAHALKSEPSNKRDDKMEDIFGPLSDDSETGQTYHEQTKPVSNNNQLLCPGKWQVSFVYSSDSDSHIDNSLLHRASPSLPVPTIKTERKSTEREESVVPPPPPPPAPVVEESRRHTETETEAEGRRHAEERRRKRERKSRERREKKLAREEVRVKTERLDEMEDLAQAGRALESKLMNEFPDIAQEENRQENKPEGSFDVFRFTDDESIESYEKPKEKKKKRKKSKEEKSRKDHHEKNRDDHDRKNSRSEEVRLPSLLPSPKRKEAFSPEEPTTKSFNKHFEVLEEAHHTSSDIEVRANKITDIAANKYEDILLPVVKNEKKKPEKFIPGFGNEVDETIHENAVKSISKFEEEERESLLLSPLHVSSEPGLSLPAINDEQREEDKDEKPRTVISQEETEDAVAALLEETFDFRRYSDEGEPPIIETSSPPPELLGTAEEEAQKETQQAVESLESEMPGQLTPPSDKDKWKALPSIPAAEEERKSEEDRPDTPQSEHDLQIDEEAHIPSEDEDESRYGGLRFDEPPKTPDINLSCSKTPEQSPRTPEIDFSRPPKTPDFPAAYYQQQEKQAERDRENAALNEAKAEEEAPQAPDVSEKEIIDIPKCVPTPVPQEIITVKREASPKPKPKVAIPVAVEEVKLVVAKPVVVKSEVIQEEKKKAEVSHPSVITVAPPKEVKEPAVPVVKKEVTPPVTAPVVPPTAAPVTVPVTAPVIPTAIPPVATPATKSVPPPAVKSVPPPAARSVPPPAARSVPPPAAKSVPPPAARSVPPPTPKSALPTVDRSVPQTAARSAPPPVAPPIVRSVAPPIVKSVVPPIVKSVVPPIVKSVVPPIVKSVVPPIVIEKTVAIKEAKVVKEIPKEVPKLVVEKVEEQVKPVEKPVKVEEIKKVEPPAKLIVEKTPEVVAEVKPVIPPPPPMPAPVRVPPPIVKKVDISVPVMRDLASQAKQEAAREDLLLLLKPEEPSVASVVAPAVPPSSEPALAKGPAIEPDSAPKLPAAQEAPAQLDTPPVQLIEKIPEVVQQPVTVVEPPEPIKEVIKEEEAELPPTIKITSPRSEIATRGTRRGGRSRRGGKGVTRGGMSTRRSARGGPRQTREFSELTVPESKDKVSAESHTEESAEEKSETSPEQQRGRKSRRGRKKKSVEPDGERKRQRSAEPSNDIYEFHDTDDEDFHFEAKNAEKTTTSPPPVSAVAGTPVKPEEKVEEGVVFPPAPAPATEMPAPAAVPVSRRDSTNEEAQSRPRIILTIKSPMKEIPKVETREEFAKIEESVPEAPEVTAEPETETPASGVEDTKHPHPSPPSSHSSITNVKSPPGPTRKSRRLQEKDSSRNTIDDIIEEVIKGNFKMEDESPVSPLGTRTTRRSVRGRPKDEDNDMKKTLRAARASSLKLEDEVEAKVKPVTVEKTEDTVEETPKPVVQEQVAPGPPPAAVPTPQVAKAEPVKLPLQNQLAVPYNPNKPEEPTTLIDPVTGLLIPMRESEEGQYIPVTSASGVSVIQPRNLDANSVVRCAIATLAPQTRVVASPAVDTRPRQVVIPTPTTVSAPSVAVPCVSETRPTTVPPRSTSAVAARIPVTTVVTQTLPSKTEIHPVVSHVPIPSAPRLSTVNTNVLSQVPVSMSVSVPAVVSVSPAVSRVQPSVARNISVPRCAPVSTPIVQPPASTVVKMVTTMPTSIPSTGMPTITVAKVQQPPTRGYAGRHDLGPGAPYPPWPNSPATATHASVIAPPAPRPAHLSSPPPHPAHTVAPKPSPGRPASNKPQVNIPPAHSSSQVKELGAKPLAGTVPYHPQPAHSAGHPSTGYAERREAERREEVPICMLPHRLRVGAVARTSAAAALPASSGAVNMEAPKVDVAMSGCIVANPPSPRGSRPVLAHSQVLQAGMPIPAYEASLHAASPGASELGGGTGAAQLSPAPYLLPPPQPQHKQDVAAASFLLAGSGQAIERVPNRPGVSLASPPPAHQGDVVRGQHPGFSGAPPPHLRPPHASGPPPHEMAMLHPQLMFQQMYRHEPQHMQHPYHLPPGAIRSPAVPGMDKAEQPEASDEVLGAQGSSPPLELRRPGSRGRLPPPAAHLHSPHDRATDSPQVATVYGARHIHHGYTPGLPRGEAADKPPHSMAPLAHHTPGLPQRAFLYEDEGFRGPPPAHHHRPGGMTGRVHPTPGQEAPPTQKQQSHLQVKTPTHASQVPPQADSLLMLLQRYPVMWQGLLALKNDQAAVQMHFVYGNPDVARESLPCNSDGSTPPLRIAQRMRLEQTQVEGVARKMQMENEHCMLLALPCGRDHMDVLQQSNNLQTGFITYLQQKQAAGIVNIAAPGSQQAAYVVHIFPSCEFANDNLARIAPDLLHRVADIAHLLIIIATV